VRRTVARINNPKNELIFRKLGIDVTVSATAAILNQIEQELPTHRLVPLMHLRGKTGLEMVEIKVPPGASIIGRSAVDLLLPQGAMISLVVDSEGNPRLPADAVIQEEDEIIVITRIEAEEQLRRALTER
jgi:trk system potassium uptake protein TrkA